MKYKKKETGQQRTTCMHLAYSPAAPNRTGDHNEQWMQETHQDVEQLSRWMNMECEKVGRCKKRREERREREGAV